APTTAGAGQNMVILVLWTPQVSLIWRGIANLLPASPPVGLKIRMAGVEMLFLCNSTGVAHVCGQPITVGAEMMMVMPARWMRQATYICRDMQVPPPASLPAGIRILLEVIRMLFC